jgi:hypothetical protein
MLSLVLVVTSTVLKVKDNSNNDNNNYFQHDECKGKGHPCTGIEALYRPYDP